MQLDREGTFRAYPMERGLKYTVNKAMECTTRFVAVQEWDGKDWYEIAEQPEIIGRTIIIKTDNTPNASGIRQLKEGFGWDGVDLQWLQDADLSEKYVQIVVKAEEYQGRKVYKVAWINPGDATPSGVQRADDATLRSLTSQYGPALRAISGGTQVKTPLPKKPASKPAANAPAATKPAAPAKSPAEELMAATYKNFWNFYPGEQPDRVNQEWFRLINHVHPGAERNPVSLMTAAEWAEVLKLAEASQKEKAMLKGAENTHKEAALGTAAADSDENMPPATDEIPF